MRTLIAIMIAGPLLASAADSLYDRAERKLQAIENRRVKRGSAVSFTPQEIDAWARVAVPAVVPEGIRDEHVELFDGSASGSAVVDLLKMRQAKGAQPNWFMSRLLAGERPLKVWVRVESGGGRCTVYLTRVELSGVVMKETVLDFLVRTFFMPLYPDAKINQPFDLDYDIDRIDITPRAVIATMKR
jgi:hypothetical protein